jgi:hypothetical protein
MALCIALPAMLRRSDSAVSKRIVSRRRTRHCSVTRSRARLADAITRVAESKQRIRSSVTVRIQTR